MVRLPTHIQSSPRGNFRKNPGHLPETEEPPGWSSPLSLIRRICSPNLVLAAPPCSWFQACRQVQTFRLSRCLTVSSTDADLNKATNSVSNFTCQRQLPSALFEQGTCPVPERARDPIAGVRVNWELLLTMDLSSTAPCPPTHTYLPRMPGEHPDSSSIFPASSASSVLALSICTRAST